MKRIRALIAMLICVCISLAAFAGCAEKIQPQSEPGTVPAPNNGTGTESRAPEVGAVTRPYDYAEIFKSLDTTYKTIYGMRDGAMSAGGELGVTMEAAVEDAAAPAAAPAMPEMTDTMETENYAAGEDDYSGTNLQVKGVDEDDIVKTDGEYIYILRRGNLYILTADGGDTKILSRTELESYDAADYMLPQSFYIAGDRLVLISVKETYMASVMEYTEGNIDVMPVYPDAKSYTAVDIYDISDRSNPRVLSSLGQDGYFNTSRMIDGYVYLVSNYWLYGEIDEDSPETFVPALYRDGAAELVPAGCIAIWPGITSVSYTVLAAYDIGAGEIASTQSMLGSCDTVYMTAENLYLAGSVWEDGASEPYEEDNYTVTEYNTAMRTEISRYSVSGGTLTLSAAGSVKGSLLNQFSLDEYGGNLRLVVTQNGEHYKIYTDEARGWSNYEWLDNSQSNALYVLDGSLEVIGSVEGLGEDERVYSVRFSGDIGYFVTFRQTDPLFAVDLSDPASPVVLSALKIPGFSQYLHVYGDGRLLGLGMNADEETGRTQGMKLSMFDTSDPADVTEKHKLSLDSDSSAALYNHKAILIAPDKDIIAFPADDGYDVYGYSDETGFYKRASIDAGAGGWDMRGLYAGGFAYIVDDTFVSVLNMEDFTGVIRLELPV